MKNIKLGTYPLLGRRADLLFDLDLDLLIQVNVNGKHELFDNRFQFPKPIKKNGKINLKMK